MIDINILKHLFKIKTIIIVNDTIWNAKGDSKNP